MNVWKQICVVLSCSGFSVFTLLTVYGGNPLNSRIKTASLSVDKRRVRAPHFLFGDKNLGQRPLEALGARLCARLWSTEIGLELGALVQLIPVAAVVAPAGSLRAIPVLPPPPLVTCPLGPFGLRVGG